MIKKFFILLTIIIFSGCSSNKAEEIISNVSVLYSSSGYISSIEKGDIDWSDETGYTYQIPSYNLRLNYYPDDVSLFLREKINDKNLVKLMSIAQNYLNKNMSFNNENTKLYYDENFVLYGYNNKNNLCLITIDTTLSLDTNDNSYVPIRIGCGYKKDLKAISKKVLPLYKDLDVSKNTVFVINKEFGDIFYHINAHSIFGYGWELIVAKKYFGYEEIYGGNSGDIPCDTMYKNNVPLEIYEVCY